MQSNLISWRILEVRGPWKLSGNWWDRTRWETKEWDIELDNGGLYRIAQKAMNTPEAWEVVGVYD